MVDLRDAAAEAGISATAFNRALAEVRAGGAGSAVHARGRSARRWVVGAIAVVVLAIGAFNASSLRATARVGASANAKRIEEAIFLQCLPGGEALELVRPLLAGRMSRATWNPSMAPRVIVLRSTPEQLRRAKALLAQYDAAATQACQAPAR